MKKHIVVEGCDGSGKDTLIGHLLEHPAFSKYTLHEKASTSLGGPVANLSKWVSDDLAYIGQMAEHVPPYVYNRHPLISEPIYSRFRTVQPGMGGHFIRPEWIDIQSRRLAHTALLVITQPPWEVVERQAANHEHLAGVAENLRHIYDAYCQLMWPGVTIRYDRTNSSLDTLIDTLRRMLEDNQ